MTGTVDAIHRKIGKRNGHIADIRMELQRCANLRGAVVDIDRQSADAHEAQFDKIGGIDFFAEATDHALHLLGRVHTVAPVAGVTARTVAQ